MGEQPKVFEYAKQIGMETLALMDKIREWKLPVKSHMAILSEESIAEIQTRLKKKSSTKKKAKTKKTTKKKTTKTTTKKVAVKKTEGSKKTVSQRKVIRRRAGATKPSPLSPSPAKAITDPAPPSPSEEPTLVVTPETPTALAKETTKETAKTKPRSNIVGRMDLKRVQAFPARSSSTAPRPQKTTTRNIRTGFVAMPMVTPHTTEGERREKEKASRKKPSAGGGGKELPVQSFAATEFRKREVIFQPKKKRFMGAREGKKTQLTTPKASKRVVQIHNVIKVSELAQKMGIKIPQLSKKLISEGIMANMNTELDFDTVSLIVPEFGFEAKNLHMDIDEKVKLLAFGSLDEAPVTRPPVVTVMGHVDHGKTTLLDAIRSADVVSSEAGGITQHIGAYRVTLADEKVATFIDTPGHAAFTEMRARGANATDIAVIVVAADDGVMPQTEEAINHAKAANVPIIVAVNKVDRPDSNPEKIKQQLMEYELIPEEWGGSTLFAEISALQKQGIENLIEQIHLVAEIQELQANPKQSATGIVIESSLKKGRGNVATLLVQDGTLKTGDFIVLGSTVGRVRHMSNEMGKNLQEAGPSAPVEVAGLEKNPDAGDRFDVCRDENLAREVAEQRKMENQMNSATPSPNMSLDDLFSKVKSGDVQELAMVLKSDVAGSNEAIKGILSKIVHDEVKINVIHTGVGGISESDILLASTASGVVIGFNVRPDSSAQHMATERGVEIKTYTIIYELIDDVKKALSGMLRPDIVEKSQGQAEVRAIFSVPKLGVIAGCAVVSGTIFRTSLLRLIREGRVVYGGQLGSLKRFKDDVKEVANGYECGIGIENYNDIKVGDVIEAYTNEEVARTLE